MSDLEALIRAIVRDELQAELSKVEQQAAPSHVTVREYATARSISISTVRNAVRAGRLPAIRIGSAVRVQANAEIGEVVKPSRPMTAEQRADRILAA